MKPRTKTNLLALAMTASCLFIGYAFWRANHYRDPIVWILLTIGLLGILMSVLRNAKN